MILSIDPGNEYSAYSLLDKNLRPVEFGKVKNYELLSIIEDMCSAYEVSWNDSAHKKL